MSSTAPDLGVQLYSVRDEPADRLEATLARLAAIGFTHVEPYDILTDTAGLANAMSATGLRAATAHAKITQLDTSAVLDAATELGIGTVLVPWADPSLFAARDSVLELAESINEVAQVAASAGIRVGYHNHDFEFSSLIDGIPAWELLVQNLDDGVVLELDTHWASVGGADVFEVMGRLRDRIRFLHLTNEPPDEEDLPLRGLDLTGRKLEVLEFGAGSVELDVLEVVVDDDVFGHLQSNFDYFTSGARTAGVAR